MPRYSSSSVTEVCFIPHFSITRRLAVTCDHLAKAHFSKFANNRPHSFCCISMPLIIGVNDISDFYFFVFYPAVVYKTDDFSIQIDSVFKVRCIFFPTEINQFLSQILHLLNGFKFRYHKSFCDLGIQKQVDQPVNILRGEWLYDKPFCFNQCFFFIGNAIFASP